MKAWAYIAALLLIAGCSGDETPPRPSHILSEDTMSIVLAEMHVFNATAQHREIRRKFMQPLVEEDMEAFFDSLNVSQEQFDESLQYYLDRPQEMLALYDGAMDLLSARLASTRPAAADSLKKASLSKEKTNKELMEEDPNVLRQRVEQAKKKAEAKGN